MDIPSRHLVKELRMAEILRGCRGLTGPDDFAAWRKHRIS